LACERLQLPPPQRDCFQLFSDQANGWGVELLGWRYPLVCQSETGALKYDSFNGQGGEPSRLEAFLQRYVADAATLAARRNGHSVIEQPLADGSIKLVIQIGGAA
jgi:hypothetical protein